MTTVPNKAGRVTLVTNRKGKMHPFVNWDNRLVPQLNEMIHITDANLKDNGWWRVVEHVWKPVLQRTENGRGLRLHRSYLAVVVEKCHDNGT